MPAPKSSRSPRKRTPARSAGDGITTFVEQLVNRVINPLDLVMLTRERIQETLDEAAERGRVTRHDANELAAELFKRGRLQTETLLSDIERLFGRGRAQLESATRRARDPISIIRTADRARRAPKADQKLPISDYDDLTARQVGERLTGLTPAQLRKVREYERRHANRKSVLSAIDRALG